MFETTDVPKLQSGKTRNLIQKINDMKSQSGENNNNNKTKQKQNKAKQNKTHKPTKQTNKIK